MGSNLRLFFAATVIMVTFIRNVGCTSMTERPNDPSSETEEQNGGSSYFFYQLPKYPRDCQDVIHQCSSPVLSGVFLVKPDGYTDPFEVYCDNDGDLGGWTVFQRRLDGSVDFRRDWEDYNKGFGFLSSEFWLGNGKLSFLTNQAQYELRIDITLVNQTSFSVSYDTFQLSDEFGLYALVKVGAYGGDEGSLYSECPPNSIYKNCDCVATCEDSLLTSGCHTDCNGREACICREGYLLKGEDCVGPNECGCYLPEGNIVIQEGEIYLNNDCSKKCTCNNDILRCNSDYECDSNAACSSKEGVRQCYCISGYEGDGQTCSRLFTDCNDVYNAGHTQDGVYSIFPSGWNGEAFNVFCNMSIDSGSWTVFQRRKTGSTAFYESWDRYKKGFGDNEDEFWLANEKLYFLTQQSTYELRIDIVSDSNALGYAKFTRFRVDDETNNYRIIELDTYSGTARNGMARARNIAFSTYDQDNDGRSWKCARKHQGGWWYGGKGYDGSVRYCDTWPRESNYVSCAYGNLNGDYTGGIGENIVWYYSSYCNIKYTEMKIRRTS